MALLKETPVVRVQRIAELSVTPRSVVTRGPAGGWLVHTPGDVLVLLGPRFEERARFSLPTRWFSTHAVSPDGAHAYLSLRTSVQCITPAGETVWDVPHPPWGFKDNSWGSCWVSPDGTRVCATVPSSGGPDSWWVMDARSGALLGQAALSAHFAASMQVGHPDGRHVALLSVMASREVDAWWGVHEPGRVTLERLGPSARNLLDIRPDGSQFLTMSSEVGGVALTGLTVRSFPDGPAVATREARDTFPNITDFPGGSDSFSGYAQYVTEKLVVATSAREGRQALLSADDLSLVGLLEFSGIPGTTVSTDGHGQLVTYDASRSLQLWALPPLG